MGWWNQRLPWSSRSSSSTAWFDLAPHLGRIWSLASARESQKSAVDSPHNCSGGRPTHFKGLCGELAVSLFTGLPMDECLYGCSGDSGHDFLHAGLRYDVKTVSYWRNPDLKEFLKPKEWSDRYILMALRDGHLVQVVGWATGDQLRSADIVDYGHGPRHNLSHTKLYDLGQMGMPHELPFAFPSLAPTT